LEAIEPKMMVKTQDRKELVVASKGVAFGGWERDADYWSGGDVLIFWEDSFDSLVLSPFAGDNNTVDICSHW
jgi:hypothetical protein